MAMVGFAKKIRKEQGVAMITIVVVSAVLMMLGGGVYVLASRENTMTRADYKGGEAFYFAEGGLENVINILNYEAMEVQLTQPRRDQSSDGFGYLMDPVPVNRATPTDPVQMNIGGDIFTVWVDEVDAYGDHCEACELDLTGNAPAYLLITAEGRSDEGYRKLQQRVMLEATGFPMSLYIDGDVNANGQAISLHNQSMFVKGNFYGRNKLTVTGADIVYGGAAGVLATGSIYEKFNGHGSQIYTTSGLPNPLYWNANYEHDRDSRGPLGNTFTVDDLDGMVETGGLTTRQLMVLKGMAQTDGYYSNPVSGNLILHQDDLPVRDGNIVVYIEFSGGSPEGNEVSLKFEWPHAPYTEGQAFVVIKNGSVKMTGQDIGYFHGSIYCPDGSVRVDGSGSGQFTGFVWGKGLTDIGNFNFNMTNEFLENAPFYAWTVTRITDWTEVDR